ncbi:acyltransferase [Morganella morganii]|uniref:Acyltransferase n=1 Tax=Morganella morganii TaxID=582 RepID=A0A433ZSR1_MORMO|nr:acyltransferase [Morganella morganii]RUT65168.1 acyltransferase [Morganella morganii]
MNKKFKVINSLTSLRFFAALGVLLHHLGLLGNSSLPPVQFAAKYFFNGYTGVTFFYILSGFIINYSFKKHEAAGVFGYKDFLFFRVARLYPVHILCLILFMALFGVFTNISNAPVLPLLSNALLVHAFIPVNEYYFSFNTVSWSISCELFFYIAFCVVVKLKTKYIISLLLSILLTNTYFIISPPDHINTHWFFYINPIFRFSDFLIGVLLCRFYLSSSFLLTKKSGTVLEVISLSLLFFTFYIASNFISDMNVKYDILFIPCMALVVFSFSYGAGYISGLLSNKILILLGEASFSLYMLHYMVISKVTELMSPNGNDYYDIFTYAITSLTISVFLSVICYKYYEKPINKVLRNAWIRRHYG